MLCVCQLLHYFALVVVSFCTFASRFFHFAFVMTTVRMLFNKLCWLQVVRLCNHKQKQTWDICSKLCTILHQKEQKKKNCHSKCLTLNGAAFVAGGFTSTLLWFPNLLSSCKPKDKSRQTRESRPFGSIDSFTELGHGVYCIRSDSHTHTKSHHALTWTVMTVTVKKLSSE